MSFMEKQFLRFACVRNLTGKLLFWQIVLVSSVLAIVGCGKGNSTIENGAAGGVTSDVPADPVDLSEVRAAFASASPALRVSLDETISLVRARQFSDAVAHTQKFAKFPNLTSEQAKSLQNLIEKLKAAN